MTVQKPQVIMEVAKPPLFSQQRLALAYRYFHVSKLARSAEAVSFLPEVADDLVPQRRRAVSEGTAVSLQHHTVRTLPQVATHWGFKPLAHTTSKLSVNLLWYR